MRVPQAKHELPPIKIRSEVEKLSKEIGIDRASLIKALNFLPYPFLLSERRQGAQHNIFVNRRFQEEMGYTCEDIPTMDDWLAQAYPDQVYREQVFQTWNELLEKAKAAGSDSVVMQARIQTKHAGVAWYEVKASILDSINFVVFVNVQEEMNRERELERLTDNQNRILSILSHDLRSPLNSLRVVLDMATDKIINWQEENVILKKISAQVLEMTDLLDTTLQWSKSNFADIRYQKVYVDVHSIIEKYINLYRDAILGKDINLSACTPVTQGLVTDPEVISIVLRNLISNAVKYTTPGGFIGIWEEIEEDIYTLAVENSGKGLSDERINAILQQNYTSELGTKGETGLGLGLRLCQQLLTRIGGHLRIVSHPGRKTIFKIVLPATCLVRQPGATSNAER
jgi:signal transduction histidine kinase